MYFFSLAETTRCGEGLRSSRSASKRRGPPKQRGRSGHGRVGRQGVGTSEDVRSEFFVAGLDYFLLTNHLRNCSFVHTPVDPVVFPIACEVVRHGRPRSPAKPKDDSPSPKTNDTKKVPSKMIHSPDDQRQCWHRKNWILKIHRTGPKQSRYFLSAFFT